MCLKNKKKYVISPVFTMVLAIILLQLSGCYTNNETSISPDITIASEAAVKNSEAGTNTLTDNSSGDLDTHIKMQLDTNLSIDANVSSLNAVTSYDTLTVSAIDFDEEALTKLLLSESTIQDKQHYDHDDGTFDLSISTTDGKELGISGGAHIPSTIYFSTSLATYVNQVFTDYSEIEVVNPDEINNSNIFAQKTDFSFMGWKDAVSEVSKFLSELGLSLYDQSEVFSLDYETLAATENELYLSGDMTNKKDGTVKKKGTWNEDDNCYYIELRCGYNGIPCYEYSSMDMDNNIYNLGSTVRAIYSKNGIEYLSVMYPYVVTEVYAENDSIITIDNAIEAFKKKYDSIIVTDPTTVVDIYLCYVPSTQDSTADTYLMTPAWCFEIKQEYTQENTAYTKYSNVLFNAVTAEEIY